MQTKSTDDAANGAHQVPKTANEKFDAILRRMDEAPDLSSLGELVDIVPDIKAIVQERKEQAIFNKKAAKIGRWIVLIAGGVGAVIGSAIAVSKLILSLGNQ